MNIPPCVLVIDDEPDTCRAMQILLRRFCDVTMVYSGEEAVNEYQRREYDLVFLDIRMPGMTGIETLKELQRLRPDTQVVMITGGDYQQEPIKEAIQLGAIDWVKKPVDRATLCALVDEAMRHRRASQQRRMGRM